MAPGLQVAAFTLLRPFAIPSFHSLHHLIQTFVGKLPFYRRALAALDSSSVETLSVVSAGPYADWSEHAIDLSALPNLKHLHLQNFAPGSVHVPQGCQLHAAWVKADDTLLFLRQWLGSSNVWKGQQNPLASLCVVTPEPLGELAMAHLKEVLGNVQEGGFIYLSAPSLGTEQEPLLISASSCQGLACATRVRIECKAICSINVTGIKPGWANLKLSAPAIYLKSDDIAALVCGLDAFVIRSIDFHGATGLQMAEELTKLGHAYKIVVKGFEDGRPDEFSFRTILNNVEAKAFTRLITCGCGCCLTCLAQKGVVADCAVRL